MLVEFTVNNFKSIKDDVKFSMLASNKDGQNNFKAREGRKKEYNLLKSTVVYGANASGKSNFLKAMKFMRDFVLNTHKIIQSTDKLPYFPFRLSTDTEDASSSFEIVFFIDDIKYRYGFEADESVVYEEWLYADAKGKESKLFYRNEDNKQYVNPDKFPEGYDFFDKKNEKIKIATNQLFLWKCDREGGEIAKSILNWFKNFNILDGTKHTDYEIYTMKQMQDNDFRAEIINLVQTADIGIEDIKVEEKNINYDKLGELPHFVKDDAVKSITTKTTHQKFDSNNNPISSEIFELRKDESTGTQKFFALSAPILDTLKEGKILIIDELDASLHPILAEHLVKLFHDKTINKKNAQLIFATHDTNLLKKSLFSRDQIWFSEKNKYGATDLYSLVQFKGVRATTNFKKQYIQGKYGAVPYLGEFEFQN